VQVGIGGLCIGFCRTPERITGVNWEQETSDRSEGQRAHEQQHRGQKSDQNRTRNFSLPVLEQSTDSRSGVQGLSCWINWFKRFRNWSICCCRPRTSAGLADSALPAGSATCWIPATLLIRCSNWSSRCPSSVKRCWKHAGLWGSATQGGRSRPAAAPRPCACTITTARIRIKGTAANTNARGMAHTNRPYCWTIILGVSGSGDSAAILLQAGMAKGYLRSHGVSETPKHASASWQLAPASRRHVGEYVRSALKTIERHPAVAVVWCQRTPSISEHSDWSAQLWWRHIRKRRLCSCFVASNDLCARCKHRRCSCRRSRRFLGRPSLRILGATRTHQAIFRRHLAPSWLAGKLTTNFLLAPDGGREWNREVVNPGNRPGRGYRDQPHSTETESQTTAAPCTRREWAGASPVENAESGPTRKQDKSTR